MDIVLLDGGMGQELIRLSSNPAHPQWSAYVMMHEPHIVQQVHAEYLHAGAKVLTLNTYSTTRRRFQKFGVEDQLIPLQRKAVDLARGAMEETGIDATIAGCLSPLVGSYHPELLPPDKDLLDEYREMAALQGPHVDVFICETMSKASEARMAAIAGAETGKPVWVAWTLNEELGEDGLPRLRSGETVAEAIAALEGVPVEALLFNCCPPEVMTAGMPILAADGRPFGGHANGFTPIPKGFVLGTTVDMLGARKDLGPEAYADHVMTWIDMGATIVGGCCEVGPAHIAEISSRLLAHSHAPVGRAA
ncbi:MAG: homocysteine S-methyltransferase family protein [Pseudomonadota bacterium]